VSERERERDTERSRKNLFGWRTT